MSTISISGRYSQPVGERGVRDVVDVGNWPMLLLPFAMLMDSIGLTDPELY